MSTTLISPVLLTTLFGILEPQPSPTPLGPVTRTKREGFWDISSYENAVAYRCRCGRSEPFLLTPEDADKVWVADADSGCHICRDESDSASTKEQKLIAWIEKHRATLTFETHLELPNDSGMVYTTSAHESKGAAMIRTRHFVFTHFYRKPVPPGSCVKTSCRKPSCLNPLHLWIAPTHAGKLSADLIQLIQTLSLKGISSKTIQKLLLEERCCELSLRSIQRIRKETKESKSSNI